MLIQTFSIIFFLKFFCRGEYVPSKLINDVPEVDNKLYGDGGKVFDWKPIVLVAPTAPSPSVPIVTPSAAVPTAPTAPSSPFNHITPIELSSVHLRHGAPPVVSQHPNEAPAIPVNPMMPSAPAAPAPPVLHTNQETAKPATPTAPQSPFTPFATTPTHIHLTPEPFGHLTAANMTWRFVRTENQTLANLTLIYMEQQANSELVYLYRLARSYLSWLFSHPFGSKMTSETERGLHHKNTVQLMAQHAVAQANAEQADKYRRLYQELSGAKSDDFLHEFYNAETFVLDAVNLYGNSTGTENDFRPQVRLTTFIDDGQVILRPWPRFVNGTREFVPLTNRDSNGVLVPGSEQWQTQFSDHRTGQDLNTRIFSIYAKESILTDIDHIKSSLIHLEQIPLDATAKSIAQADLSKQLTDLHNATVTAWLARPATDKDESTMQDLFSAVSEISSKVQRALPSTSPQQLTFEKINGKFVIKRAGQELTKSPHRLLATRTIGRYHHLPYTQEEKDWFENLKYDFLQAELLQNAKRLDQVLRYPDMITSWPVLTKEGFIQDKIQFIQGLLIAIKRINRHHQLKPLYEIIYELETAALAVVPSLRCITAMNPYGQVITNSALPQTTSVGRKPLSTGFFKQALYFG